MPIPETDIDKLRLALAYAALTLLAYEENASPLPQVDSPGIQPFGIAQMLGYPGDFDNAAIWGWLKAFVVGDTARRVANRERGR